MTTAAAGSAVTAALAMLGNQGRSVAVAPRVREDTSTSAIALAVDRRARRDALKNAREERMHSLLTDPQLMGMAMVIGGLILSTNIPFSHDRKLNAKLQALSASSCVMMGLGRAGVGDLTTLGMSAAAGATVATGSGSLPELIDAATIEVPGTDIPIASVAGPIPMLEYLWHSLFG